MVVNRTREKEPKPNIAVKEVKKNRTYPTMRPIGPPPLLRGLIDLNMPHDQIARVQALGIRIRLRILQQAQQELGRLLGPPRLADPELLALRGAAGGAGVAAHGHGFLVLEHVAQVGEGAVELPAVDGLCRFARVLEGHTQVGSPRARGFRGVDLGGRVADLVA